MNKHFSFFLSLVQWYLNHTSHNSQILSSNISVFIPIGTITQLGNTSKHDWVPYVVDCICSQNIIGGKLNCGIKAPQESSYSQRSDSRIQKTVTSLFLQGQLASIRVIEDFCLLLFLLFEKFEFYISLGGATCSSKSATKVIANFLELHVLVEHILPCTLNILLCLFTFIIFIFSLLGLGLLLWWSRFSFILHEHNLPDRVFIKHVLRSELVLVKTFLLGDFYSQRLDTILLFIIKNGILELSTIVFIDRVLGREENFDQSDTVALVEVLMLKFEFHSSIVVEHVMESRRNVNPVVKLLTQFFLVDVFLSQGQSFQNPTSSLNIIESVLVPIHQNVCNPHEHSEGNVRVRLNGIISGNSFHHCVDVSPEHRILNINRNRFYSI